MRLILIKSNVLCDRGYDLVRGSYCNATQPPTQMKHYSDNVTNFWMMNAIVQEAKMLNLKTKAGPPTHLPTKRRKKPYRKWHQAIVMWPFPHQQCFATDYTVATRKAKELQQIDALLIFPTRRTSSRKKVSSQAISLYRIHNCKSAVVVLFQGSQERRDILNFCRYSSLGLARSCIYHLLLQLLLCLLRGLGGREAAEGHKRPWMEKKTSKPA